MASSKPETTTTASRPMNAQRPVSSTGPVNVPARNGTPRNHSHSISLGVSNSGHRIARRKSMSNNFSGVAAVVQGLDEASLEALVTPDGHASVVDGGSFQRAGSTSTVKPAAPANADPVSQGAAGTPNMPSDIKSVKSKPGPKGNKVRRSSEGAYLSKSDKKRASGDIRCETCGKGYKHSSCLTKHLWEHTPQWQVTSKLLISKHQQVQMLEAASVLVTMNNDLIPGTVETIKVFDDSDRSSQSPMPSGSSVVQDEDVRSIETSPPPMIEAEEEEEEDEMEFSGEEQIIDHKEHHRYSSTSSVFSQSYQSMPSMAGSIPISTSYSSYHHFGKGARRPSTSGTAYSVVPGDDDAKLAAAVEGVSFGTPKSVATYVDDDVPPVPPLPARYASQKAYLSSSAFAGFGGDLSVAGLTQRISDERGGRQPSDERLSRRSVSRGPAEDEYGMFSMEE